MSELHAFFEPSTHLSWWSDWLVIILGCTCTAAGFVFFINPYNLVPGGIYGLSIVVHNLVPWFQIGTISYAFEIPLLILALLFLGKSIGIRTIIAALVTPMIMNGISLLAYPTAEALHKLDPTLIAGGHLNLSDHLMLTTIMGGTLIGLGCGLVARNRATGGGTDIVAMFTQKYLHVRFSKAIFIVDALVVLSGFLVIGLGLGTGNNATNDCYLSFYSLIAIYISSRMVSMVINGFKNEQIIFIIGRGRMDKLRDYIINDLDRSATCIKSSGLYSGEDKDMLFLVVKEKEVTRIKQKIKTVEPDSFIVITDAYDTFGEGFRDLPNSGDIMPE